MLQLGPGEGDYIEALVTGRPVPVCHRCAGPGAHSEEDEDEELIVPGFGSSWWVVPREVLVLWVVLWVQWVLLVLVQWPCV